MSHIPMWRRYLRFWRTDVESDVDAELTFHFESRIAELCARVVPAEEARRQASEEFGDEAATRASLNSIGHRMERRRMHVQWWDAVRADLRYTLRGLGMNPVFTIAVVLTLAVGIGAATTMYDVMRRLIIQTPPGVTAPQELRRLYFMYETPGSPRVASNAFSFGYLEHVRAEARTVVGAAYMTGQELVVGRGADAAPARATLVSAGFWSTLGVRPMLGRFISDDEAHPAHGRRVAVLGHAYWEQRFGGDSTLIGQTIAIMGKPYEVIGVAPRGFRGVDLTRTDIWLPLFAYADAGVHLRWWEGSINLAFVVRLLPARTEAQAAQELTSLRLLADGEQPRRFSEDAASRVKRMPVLLSGVAGALGYDGKRLPEATVSLWLVGVALILLGIAIANVASLLLLRALRRRQRGRPGGEHAAVHGFIGSGARGHRARRARDAAAAARRAAR